MGHTGTHNGFYPSGKSYYGGIMYKLENEEEIVNWLSEKASRIQPLCIHSLHLSPAAFECFRINFAALNF